jgi:hypothetical protein
MPDTGDKEKLRFSRGTFWENAKAAWNLGIVKSVMSADVGGVFFLIAACATAIGVHYLELPPGPTFVACLIAAYVLMIVWTIRRRL